MAIKYRKSIEEKCNTNHNDDFIETLEKYGGENFRISEESRSASIAKFLEENEENDSVILSEHIDTLKYSIKRCDFSDFENKMDNDINRTGKKLEYLNRMDIFDEGNFFGLNKKHLFALDKDEKLYKYDWFHGFIPHEKVSKMKIRKILKNKKGKNVRAGRELIRDSEYPFIVIDLCNNKYKFDREYFENIYIKSETKLVEEIARKYLTKIELDNKIGYINEDIFYDLDFNIIKDLEKERKEKIDKEEEKLNSFMKEEGLDKEQFNKDVMSDYQKAKYYLKRNGYSWGHINRMNHNKIFYEANSMISFKAREKGLSISVSNPYKRKNKKAYVINSSVNEGAEQMQRSIYPHLYK